jgi:nitrate reductase cytochrome c-type subunit
MIIVTHGTLLTNPVECGIIPVSQEVIEVLYCHVCGEEIDTGNSYVSFKDAFVHNDCIDSYSNKEYECDGCHVKYAIEKLFRVAQNTMCDSCIDKFTEVME